MDSDGAGWSPRDDESETRDGEQEQRSPAPSQPSQGTQTNLSAARGHATLLMPFCELEPLHQQMCINILYISCTSRSVQNIEDFGGSVGQQLSGFRGHPYHGS